MSLPFSSAATLFTSLAQNAAKFSTPFARAKLQPQAWRSAKVEEAASENVRLLLPLIEVIKIVKLASPFPDMPRLSLPRSRLRHGRRHVISIPLNLCIHFSVLLLALLPPLLTFFTVFLPRSWLGSSPITGDPTFPFPIQKSYLGSKSQRLSFRVPPSHMPWGVSFLFLLSLLPPLNLSQRH